MRVMISKIRIRKIVSLLMAVLLVIALAGCGQAPGSANGTNAADNSNTANNADNTVATDDP